MRNFYPYVSGLILCGLLLIFIDFVVVNSFAKVCISIPSLIGGVWNLTLLAIPKLRNIYLD